MGQHSWFLKDKELYFEQEALYGILDKFERGEVHLDDMELSRIDADIEEIEMRNETEYHDLFRTNKRNEDGTYTDDVIFSREECFEWIDRPENLVTFKKTVFDTDEQERVNREYAVNKLNEFWDIYPNGVIYFI